ncbi:MAG TPA: LacI family DNA-binding transcriptional regulator [Roseiflexaceae bacterium]|nr:LacI family DNA-binding transcriptional regulator [Roseiflexaceae bacterium]
MSARTIKDVADAAGVSPAAVSLFLNDRPGISQATRERIAAAIRSLGYVPRANNRRAASGAFVGMLVERLPLPVHADHFYAGVLQGLQAEAERLGYNLALSVVDPAQGGLPRLIAEQHAAGIVAVGGGDITDALLDRVAEEGVPLVAVDNQSRTRSIDCVVTDNQQGAYALTQHLLALGHRRIAFIQGPAKYKSLGERYQGYCQALREAGLPLDERLVQPAISSGIPRKGYREMQRLLELDPLPTAVFAASDRTAVGALDAIRERGLRVPDDISLAGFDGVALGEYANPPLTTVRTRTYEMGVAAMQRLDALIGGRAVAPMRLVLYTDLVVRQSTAPPRR